MNRIVQRSWLCALALGLCVLHAWMAASVSRNFSTTFDEIAHLTAGYAYWTESDYRFQPENGNLPQRLAALPLLAQNLAFPPISGNSDWDTGNVWRIGHAFFHQSNNDLPAMLAAGRAMNAALSGALCFVIFWWTRSLFGSRAALLSLTLAVFCPVLLGNGGLVTSDTSAALGFAVASLAWWRLLKRVTWGTLLAAGVCAGLLAISKHSVVLFAPMAVIMTCIRLVRPAPLAFRLSRDTKKIGGWRRIPAFLVVAFVCVTICVTIIWSAYGFRYQAAPPNAKNSLVFMEPWDAVLLRDTPPTAIVPPGAIDLRPGPVQAFVRAAREYRLLPEAWLYGLSHVERTARGRMSYFAGEYRLTGWRGFFPAVFLSKTTLPALALIVLAIGALVALPAKRRTAFFYELTPLLTLLAVYWVFSIQSRLNIGHRHLLPVYPAFYILAAGGWLLVARHRAWIAVLLVLLGWHVRESIAIRPDYIAHFNQLAGGPENAPRLFVDSSLDWGQDLPRLRLWLDANARNERVFLSYFGTGDPKHAGIEATRIGDATFDRGHVSRPMELTAGVYCISATMLSQVYSPLHGPWTEQEEAAYRQLAAWQRYLKSLPPGARSTWFDGSMLSDADLKERLDRFENLLFARLCHFLRIREPDARAGYSILIYRLDAEEIRIILQGPPPR